MKSCAEENQINLNDLEEVLLPITESCTLTKDNISNGKYDYFLLTVHI